MNHCKRMMLWLGVVLACICVGTAAAEFDAGAYSYEELLAIRGQIDARLEEMDRQYARENANRAFSFEQEEVVAYIGKTTRQLPVVERLDEAAPQRTEFTWSSSAPDIAQADGTGLVYIYAPGDAIITATAVDNPYLDVSYTVHAAIPVEKVTVWGPEEPIHLREEGTEAVVELGYSVEPEDVYFQGITWSSSDETIATVDENGTVHGLMPGKVTITATSVEDPPNGPEPKKATYELTVVQDVTEIAVSTDSIRLPLGNTCTVETTVLPENATNRSLTWVSSNVFIARVANGTIEAVGQGECVITCAATDGSLLFVNIPVRVPTFSVEKDAYTVSGKSGIVIPVKIGKEGAAVEIRTDGDLFSAEWNESGAVMIRPMKAGEGTLVLENPEAEKDRTEITITVEDSAVYNQVSYPNVKYDLLMQKPEEYEGTPISFYGCVWVKNTDAEGNTVIVVGTNGEDYSDQVFEIQCGPEWMEKLPELEEKAMFYGLYRSKRLYSEALGSEVLVPGMELELVEREKWDE